MLHFLRSILAIVVLCMQHTQNNSYATSNNGTISSRLDTECFPYNVLTRAWESILVISHAAISCARMSTFLNGLEDLFHNLSIVFCALALELAQISIAITHC